MASPDPVFTRRRPAGSSRRLRFVVLALPVCLVLLLVALFCARWWLEGYLKSEGFRRFLDDRISQSLHADAHLDPLHWQNGAVYSGGLTADGNAGSPLRHVNAEQVHADLNLRALWHRVWRVDSISSERLEVKLAPGAGTDQNAAPILAPPPANPSEAGGWLPNRVEVGEVRVADFSFSWPGQGNAAGGGFQQVQVTARPGEDEGTWLITGQGGRLVQEGVPTIRLDHTSVKTTRREVFLNQLAGQSEGGGRVELSGRQELGGERNLDLTAVLDGVPVERFLPVDWRARLGGAASGQVHVTGSGGNRDSWRARGHLDLRDGHLEALPALDQLALFTATASFRQAALQVGGGDFDWSPQRLSITHLTLESAGLLRLEGGFTVERGQIDGQFKVGVARSAMRWLAGAGTRVFNEPEHGGYVWTSIHLTGPVDNPHEDLTPRLAAAIQQEAVDKATKGAGSVIDTAGSLLDLLRPH